jgi:hypothetical protein
VSVIGNLVAGTSLALLVLATAPAAVAAQLLLDGTIVPVRLAGPINSEDAKTGETIRFVVTRDVVVDGAVVIARGTPVVGTVLAARRASTGFIWHEARLAFTFIRTTGVDGRPIQLRAVTGGGNGRVTIDRDDREHRLQWATEGDTFEASVSGNYEF